MQCRVKNLWNKGQLKFQWHWEEQHNFTLLWYGYDLMLECLAELDIIFFGMINLIALQVD